jgi:hypothetical protein
MKIMPYGSMTIMTLTMSMNFTSGNGGVPWSREAIANEVFS